ncbi:MAG: flavin reductase [Phycisphaerae bacterium]|nr:flavin reductase [Phycisphaerae bacterium]
MKEMEIDKLNLNIIDLWKKRWLLLTAGTIDDCNMMTVAWGSIGYMWNKPFAQVVVRPQRHTYQYMEQANTFTLCAFPDQYRKDLQTLGTISGRDGDKLTHTSLTLTQSTKVAAPSYNQANLILQCNKIYHQDMTPECFIDRTIDKNYKSNDYHRIYFGHIIAISLA